MSFCVFCFDPIVIIVDSGSHYGYIIAINFLLILYSYFL